MPGTYPRSLTGVGVRPDPGPGARARRAILVQSQVFWCRLGGRRAQLAECCGWLQRRAQPVPPRPGPALGRRSSRSNRVALRVRGEARCRAAPRGRPHQFQQRRPGGPRQPRPGSTRPPRRPPLPQMAGQLGGSALSPATRTPGRVRRGRGWRRRSPAPVRARWPSRARRARRGCPRRARCETTGCRRHGLGDVGGSSTRKASLLMRHPKDAPPGAHPLLRNVPAIGRGTDFA
jgi:hypothetical protein